MFPEGRAWVFRLGASRIERELCTCTVMTHVWSVTEKLVIREVSEWWSVPSVCQVPEAEKMCYETGSGHALNRSG